MKYSLFIPVLASLLILSACGGDDEKADAYGNFEAVETTISAEANGKLLWLDVLEGQVLDSGQLVAVVDTTSLILQRAQVDARIQALGQKLQDPEPQVEVMEEQIRNLVREKKRVENLLADDAATPKQLDDLSGQLDVLEQQIKTAREQAKLANKALLSEKDPLRAQQRVLDEQIRKCYVYNPVQGTVLTKYAELYEVVRFGSPLYKLADLKHLILRAYISGDQLGSLRLGQQVTVLVDAPDGKKRSLRGKISWVADEAEFTPKTIQTREERVSLVYAVKVRVPNDGSLKIGMPGELWLQDPQAEESVSASTKQ